MVICRADGHGRASLREAHDCRRSTAALA